MLTSKSWFIDNFSADKSVNEPNSLMLPCICPRTHRTKTERWYSVNVLSAKRDTDNRNFPFPPERKSISSHYSRIQNWHWPPNLCPPTTRLSPLFAVNQTTTWRFSSNHAGGVKGINNGGNQFCVLVTFHTEKKKKKWRNIYYISTIGARSFHPNLPLRFPSCVLFWAISWNVLAGFTTTIDSRRGQGMGMFERKKQKSPLNASGDQFVLHGGSAGIGWRTWWTEIGGLQSVKFFIYSIPPEID